MTGYKTHRPPPYFYYFAAPPSIYSCGIPLLYIYYRGFYVFPFFCEDLFVLDLLVCA